MARLLIVSRFFIQTIFVNTLIFSCPQIEGNSSYFLLKLFYIIKAGIFVQFRHTVRPYFTLSTKVISSS